MKKIVALLSIMVFYSGCISTSRFHAKSVDTADCSCNEQASYLLFPGDRIQVSCYKLGLIQSKYAIQVNDRIVLRFPSLPEYTTDQTVKPDGTINVPRLASFPIAGLTVAEATDSLISIYKTIDWQPEFFIVISEFDIVQEDIQSVLMKSTSQSAGSVTVRPDGFADFPIIGSIPVAGKSMDTVESIVSQKYTEMYSRLKFELSLDKVTGDRAFVFGQVSRPGAYAIGQTKLIYELIASAGGFLPSASLTNVLLINVQNDTVKCKRVNLNTSGLKGRPVKDLTICPGTIVYIPGSILSTMAEITKAISGILFFQGFGLGLSWDLSN